MYLAKKKSKKKRSNIKKKEFFSPPSHSGRLFRAAAAAIFIFFVSLYFPMHVFVVCLNEKKNIFISAVALSLSSSGGRICVYFPSHHACYCVWTRFIISLPCLVYIWYFFLVFGVCVNCALGHSTYKNTKMADKKIFFFDFFFLLATKQLFFCEVVRLCLRTHYLYVTHCN